MAERSISEEDVELTVFGSESVRFGFTAAEYHRVVRGVPFIAIVVRDSAPPLVITIIADESP